MILLSNIDKIKKQGEIVISDSDLGISAHKELFSFNDDVYLKLNCDFLGDSVNDLLREINDYLNLNIVNIHFVFGWNNLVQIAMWKFDSYSDKDINLLLAHAEVNLNSKEKISPVDIQELFDSLFTRGSFSILRKICHLAKKQIDNRLENKSIHQTIFHLVAPQTRRIIASSL